MRNLLTLLVLLVGGPMLAQTIDFHNEGRFYISPETLLSSTSSFVNEAEGWFTNDGEVIFKANYTNEGVVDFTTGSKSGMTRFEGVSFQQINGEAPSEFYSLYFDNISGTTPFGLTNDIFIFGDANFINGIVDNKTYNGSVVFQAEAIPYSASDLSYVEGVVEKSGTTTFVYPVGASGHYRPAATILGEETESHFSTQYIYKNSNGLYPHQQQSVDIIEIDKAEYWEITSTKVGENVLIRLTYDDATTPLALTSDPEKLGVVAWNTVEKRWVSLGGAVNTDLKEVISTISPKDYVAFTLGTVRKAEQQDIIVYNGINPNDVGGNDYLKIVGLNKYPNNHVQIFNRWGVKVFETRKYDTHGNVFRGRSDGRVTIAEDKDLPIGTYFYVIEYQDENTGEMKSLVGYLYLNR